MSSEESQIEFYFGLGCEPVLIGASSIVDYRQACREGEALNAVSVDERRAAMSAGTRHVLRELGRHAGVEPTTAQALNLYEIVAERGREAFLQKLINPKEPTT